MKYLQLIISAEHVFFSSFADVLNTFRTIFRWIIWSVLSLYILVIVLLHIPAVQSFLAHQVALAAGEKLGTRVKVGRIDLGMFNRIVIDDFLLYDQKSKPMLSASRIGARIDLIHLLSTGEINVSSAQLFGLKAILYKENKNADPNFKFVLDSLASKDTTQHTPLHLSINSLVIRHGSIRYDQLDKDPTPSKFNINHISLSGISSHIILNKLDDNSVWATLRSLAFTEHSGLEVKNLTFNLKADKKQASLDDFILTTTNSKVEIDNVTAAYEIKQGGLVDKRLNYDVKQLSAKITPSDFAALLPLLRPMTETYQLALSVKGSEKKINVRQLFVENKKHKTLINANGWLSGLDKRTSVHAKINTLKIDGENLQRVAKIANFNIPKPLTNVGDIFYKGTVEHHSNFTAAKGNLQTGAGEILLDASIEGKKIKAYIDTKDLNLGKILSNYDFGKANLKIKAEGLTDVSKVVAQGKINSFEYKGYNYKNISIDGRYQDDRFEGLLALNDPNGELDFKGSLEHIRAFIKHRQRLIANLVVNAKNVNLQQLRLTDAVGNWSWSFQTTIKGNGSTLNDINGEVNIDNFNMIGEGQQVALKAMNIKMSNGLISRSLDATTDFAEVHVNGQYDYTTLPQSVEHVISYYLPSLAQPRKYFYQPPRKNDYAFSLKLRDSKLLNQFLKTSLQIDQPIAVVGTLNERNNELNVAINAPHINYAGQTINDLSVKMITQSGGLLAKISGKRSGEKGPQVALNMEGLIDNNTIISDLHFDIAGRTPIYGNLNLSATLNKLNSGIETNLHFNPSVVNIDTVALTVQPSDITYRKNNLIINHFELSNRNQHIIANGQTTGNDNDSVMVQFKDMDIPYIMDLINFHSVDFYGLASGTASIKSFFHNPHITADLEVKNFEFEEGDMGVLYANLNYNAREGKLNIDAHADADDARTDIRGYVDIKNSYINLPIYANDSHLYFLKSYCGSFMDNINLRANGWCKVVGPLSSVNLEGDMEAYGTALVKSTGTTYAIKNARIRMLPNEIIFEHDTIMDNQGHIGVVTGGLFHQNLKRLTYDINIAAHNLLAYNFPQKTNVESFWGVVYGTGSCNIKGGIDGTELTIDMAPEKNTFITYDATAVSNVNANSFIRWIKNDSTTIGDGTGNDSIKRHKEAEETDKFNIPSDLHMTFLLRTNPNLTLGVILDQATGDNIKLNGNGIIRATYFNKGTFQLLGNYNVDYGQYNLTIQNIIKKQFIFRQGSTIAFGGDPFSAALNLKGSYLLNSVPLSDLGLGRSFTTNNTKVNCLLNIEGTPAAPTVNFGLDLPSLSPDAQQMVRSILNSEQELNQQVLYLLAVGRFYPQGNNNAPQGLETQSQTSLAMQSLLSGTISQQINTVLSNVVNTSNWNFGANIATGNDGFSNAEYEGTLSGSILNNRLLINGQFGYRDNVAKDRSSFIGDFDIRYLIFPSGNIALRMYNQTNDRYFTRNSLTTQGIGLILKKEFNNLGEIIGKKRKKAKKQAQKH